MEGCCSYFEMLLETPCFPFLVGTSDFHLYKCVCKCTTFVKNSKTLVVYAVISILVFAIMEKKRWAINR